MSSLQLLMSQSMSVPTISSADASRQPKSYIFRQVCTGCEKEFGEEAEGVKCEDNPLYFLHEEKESAQKKNEQHQDDRPITCDIDKQPTPDPELQTSPPSTPPPVDTVLNDLDQEYLLFFRTLGKHQY